MHVPYREAILSGGGWSLSVRLASRVPIMFKELLTVVPDLLGLIWGLFKDPRVPASRKVALGALIAYLSTPVDLVPDFIPLLG